MLRETLEGHGAETLGGFRHRGHHHVSRIEGFSDAVFGFSLTLLVVSLEVPHSFADLLTTIKAFPGFAASFALLANIWFLQYRFFRRYAMEDTITIWLNITLLFVIVFFTYPLKFLFRLAFAPGSTGMSTGDVLSLYAIFDSGYAAVFAIFLLLHAHALMRRRLLSLTPLEIFETKAAIVRYGLQISVAGISLAAVMVACGVHAYELAVELGGWAYPACLAIGMTLVGWITSARRRRYERQPVSLS